MTLIGFLISLLTFLTVFLGIFAINLVFTDLFKQDKQDRLDVMERELKEQLRQKMRNVVTQAGNDTDISILSANASKVDHLTAASFWKTMNGYCLQSGVNVSASQLVTLSMTLAAGTMIIVWLLANHLVAASACAAGVAWLPIAYVQFKRKSRLDKLRSQLPDALELMSRIMRAGQTINQGMQVVAEEFRKPVSYEFAYCYEQQNLGISAEVALRQLAERTGLMEIRIFVMGVLIQTQTGGNLAMLLDKLSEIIRKRAQMREQVKTLTAEGRLQAMILLGLPFAMWFGLLIINRTYALKLLDHPELIWITLGAMFLGAVWIRKIVNFDF